MKKSLLISISKNNLAVNLTASIGTISLFGIIILPFLGFFFLPFLCVIISAICFVMSAQFEAQLRNNLKEAKEQLGLSMFTNEKQLLTKCLTVYKSI